MSESTQQEPRAWTETGAALFDRERATREGHNYAAGREAVEAAIDNLTWEEVDEVGALPYSRGAAITALIQELSLPRVSRVAHDGTVPVRDDVERAHGLYGLYGIEANYADGRVRAYFVDRGTDVLPVAVDRWPAAPLEH